GRHSGAYPAQVSYPENGGVARLDLLALLLDCGGVALHQLDRGERRAPGLLLDLRVERMPSGLDEDLLALRAEQEVLEQAGRVGIGRAVENRARRDDQRRTFARMDDLHRLALLLEHDQDRVGAVHLHGALAE